LEELALRNLIEGWFEEQPTSEAPITAYKSQTPNLKELHGLGCEQQSN